MSFGEIELEEKRGEHDFPIVGRDADAERGEHGGFFETWNIGAVE